MIFLFFFQDIKNNQDFTAKLYNNEVGDKVFTFNINFYYNEVGDRIFTININFYY